MYLPLFLIPLLLRLVATAIWIPSQNATQDSHNEDPFNEDPRSSSNFWSNIPLQPKLPSTEASPGRRLGQTNDFGAWTIVSCQGRARHLRGLLADLREKLHDSHDEAYKGVQTQAFRALFKTDDNIQTVVNVYDGILSGKTPAYRGSSNVREADHSIEFKCIDSIKTSPRDWGVCKAGAAAFYDDEIDPYTIRLCPLFFRTRSSFPDGGFCPHYLRIGSWMFPDSEPSFKFGQLETLAHELAHIYLGPNFLGALTYDPVTGQLHPVPGVPGEAYRTRDSIKLSAADSVKNADNFAIFLAGERPVHFIIHISY